MLPTWELDLLAQVKEIVWPLLNTKHDLLRKRCLGEEGEEESGRLEDDTSGSERIGGAAKRSGVVVGCTGQLDTPGRENPLEAGGDLKLASSTTDSESEA